MDRRHYHPLMPLPPRALIGMVHVHALPGSPGNRHPIDRILRDALAEAAILAATGFDVILIENMHDRPYIQPPHGPETVACMTRIAAAIRETHPRIPLGIQVLACGEREALAVALASGASFIRCENFVFSHVADEGLMPTAAAGPLLRYRRSIGAGHIAIYADLKKKHASHAITADIPLTDAAHAAEFFGADGVIVTGTATGRAADVRDVTAVASATSLPVLVGSGVTLRDGRALLGAGAGGLIVGSFIKRGGRWSNPVDKARCKALVAAVRRG